MTGVIGIIHNKNAITRWFFSRPLTTKYAMALQRVLVLLKSIILTQDFTQLYGESVDKMLEFCSNGTFIDLFDLDFFPSRYLNFANGIEPSLDVDESVV